MNAAEFVARYVPDARRCQDGSFKGKCRAHDDRNPSLSVSDGDRGVVVKCHAGCALDAIASAHDFRVADLFYDRANGNRSRRIIATYDYTDAAGALLSQSVRYEPKDFRQRRPDGAGGWIWNLQGVRIVPYRLPDLAEARRVYVPEGERDSDTLRAHGLIATCNHGGAGKWRDEHTRALVDAAVGEVIVLPDNDEPGEKHARAVAQSCGAAGIAAKIVRLPDLPPKGDVSDWLAAGHTAAELEALADGAPDVETEQTAATQVPRALLISAADFALAPPAKPIWLVDQLILEAANGWIGAGAKIGKSYLALDLLLACALGEPWLGRFAIPRPLTVVLVEEEDSAWRVYERLRRLASGRGVDVPANLYLAIRQGIQFDDAATFDPLLLELRALQPALIAWDVFNRLHTADEGRRDQMMPILKRIDRIRDSLGASNLIAHHSRKQAVSGPDLASGGQRLRGLSEFWAWAENSLYLSRHKNAVTIEPESKDAIVEPFVVHLDDLPDEPDARRWVYDGPAAARLTAGERARAAIVAALQGGDHLDKDGLASRSGIPVRTIERYLPSLVKDGVLDCVAEPGNRGRRRLYWLANGRSDAETAP